MSSKRIPKVGENQVEDVAKVALGMLAIGLSAGLALIAGANRIGEALFARDEEKDPDRKSEE